MGTTLLMRSNRSQTGLFASREDAARQPIMPRSGRSIQIPITPHRAPQVICRINLYGVKARLRRAGGLRAALRAVLDRLQPGDFAPKVGTLDTPALFDVHMHQIPQGCVLIPECPLRFGLRSAPSGLESVHARLGAWQRARTLDTVERLGLS